MNEMEFSFPFPPYDIQKQFMIALSDALEKKKLGIFESPTGTGKSLSIICGALTWLEQHSAAYKARLKEVLEENIVEDPNDWFTSATKRIEKENEKRKSKKELVRIEKTEKRIEALKLHKGDIKRKFHGQTNPWAISTSVNKDMPSYNSKNLAALPEDPDLSSPDQNFLLDNYTSDGEEDTLHVDSEEEEEDHGCLKIFYCSRTHSQLAQFVKEVHKTRFQHDSRVVSLGSRSNLCINEAVSQLPFPSMINERCLELQEKKSSSHTEAGDQCSKKQKISAGCPYNKQAKVTNLADQALVEVQDIEQLVSAGRKSQACPYYASRKGIKDAQLVVVPYQCLLHRGTREACGIHLEGNVVIVDEAHNLLETLSNIHSASLSLHQVFIAEGQLSEYLQRYEKRLSPKNLLYIRQIMFIIKAYKRFITGALKMEAQASGSGTCASSPRILNLQDFLLETLTDNLSLLKLVQYMQKSNIAHKVDRFKKFIEGEIKINPVKMASNDVSTASFLAKMTHAKSSAKAKGLNQSEGEKQTPSEAELLCKEVDVGETNSGCPLLSLIEFLKTITHGSSDGRIVVSPSKDAKTAFLKYLVLNPAAHFHDIVRQCRSVIVAGGTMAPVDEFKNQLFLSAGATPDRVVAFSCSHVVAAENILPLVLTKGPGGTLMDFTFKNRTNLTLLDDLGRALTNLCNVVPGGIVFFLPSYAFEDAVFTHFEKTNVIRRVLAKKKVFREPKKSSHLEKVLVDYCRAISTPDAGGQTGSVLFSVVGGKMSEGINFSDAFGRCIIMVGVPYANAASPELKEKMDYLNKHFPASDGKAAGTTYYENLCFKAVNQSIGRSIRHRNDYASILLVDHRYSLASSQSRLPSWISPHLKVCHQFGQAFTTVRKFFLEKKQAKLPSTESLSTN